MKRLFAAAIVAFTATVVHVGDGLSKQEQAQYDAMMSAIDHNDLAVVQRFIQQKLSLSLQPDTRAAPTFMTEAAGAGRDQILEALLAAGGDIESSDGDGMTPLMHAIARQHLSTVALLIKRGADVNAEAPRGDTPLALAKEGKNREIEQALVKAGAK